MPWGDCIRCSPFFFDSCLDFGRDKAQCSASGRRIKLFMYEDSGWGAGETSPAKSETQGLYVFLSGLVLLTGIFLIGFDLFVGIREGGKLPERVSQRHREPHMHYNTSTSSVAPDLSQREYWL